MPRLSEEESRTRVAALPGWDVTPDGIRKTFTFADFRAGIAFVNRVADLAEARQHHPDIDIRYNKVTLTSISHDEGGITGRDFGLAEAAEKAACRGETEALSHRGSRKKRT